MKIDAAADYKLVALPRHDHNSEIIHEYHDVSNFLECFANIVYVNLIRVVFFSPINSYNEI